MTRHVAIQYRRKKAFSAWLEQLQQFAMREAEHEVDITADFWEECFDDGMSPEQAFRESFAEQDGV